MPHMCLPAPVILQNCGCIGLALAYTDDLHPHVRMLCCTCADHTPVLPCAAAADCGPLDEGTLPQVELLLLVRLVARVSNALRQRDPSVLDSY
jgi:hypothetical protein